MNSSTQHSIMLDLDYPKSIDEQIRMTAKAFVVKTNIARGCFNIWMINFKTTSTILFALKK